MVPREQCSRYTYPESYITKYTSIRRHTDLLPDDGKDLAKRRTSLMYQNAANAPNAQSTLDVTGANHKSTQ